MKRFLISIRDTFSFNFWDVVGIGLAIFVIKQRTDVTELFGALMEWVLYLLMFSATVLVRLGDWVLLKRANKSALKGEFFSLFKDFIRVVMVYWMTISAYFFHYVFL